VELGEGIRPFGLKMISGPSSTSEMKDGGAAYQIRVPHPNGTFDAHLPHQKAVHPPESELQEFDSLIFEMRRERRFGFSLMRYGEKRLLTVYPLDELAHPLYQALDTWLLRDIIVLYPIKQLGEAPEGICFYGGKHGRREVGYVELLRVRVCRSALAHSADAGSLPIYALRNTWKNGQTRSLIPWTYPLAG
jgi:hypothetical protein